MLRREARSDERSAFTMIELLIVIAIIAILAGLTVAAVMRVLGRMPEVQTRTDISQMDAALGAFMSEYGLSNPPPSLLYLSEDGSQYYSGGQVQPQYASTVAFLRQWLGKNFNIAGKYDWNGNKSIDPPYVLQGQQCLVFYLGGIPVWSGGTVVGMSGFASNNTNPALPAVAGTTRKGPYFNFVGTRLSLPTSAPPPISPFFPVYLDGWNAHPAGQPYVFYSTGGKINNYSSPVHVPPSNDCSMFDSAGPYYEMTSTGANFTFNTKYQIISAGKDGVFGGGLWDSAGGATLAGHDDQANFAANTLGSGL